MRSYALVEKSPCVASVYRRQIMISKYVESCIYCPTINRIFLVSIKCIQSLVSVERLQTCSTCSTKVEELLTNGVCLRLLGAFQWYTCNPHLVGKRLKFKSVKPKLEVPTYIIFFVNGCARSLKMQKNVFSSRSRSSWQGWLSSW